MVAAAVAVGVPSGTMGASAACVDYEWHAVAVVAVAAAGVAEAAVAGVDSFGFGADCGTAAVAVAFAVAAVGIGVPLELDCHCVLGTVASAVGILDWKRKTSATLAKGAAVAVVVVAGCCHLSEWACPEAWAFAVASVDPDGAASDSKECFHRAFPVVGGCRASAGGSAAVVAHSGDPARTHAAGEHFPNGGGESAAGGLAVDCVAVAEAEDAIR